MSSSHPTGPTLEALKHTLALILAPLQNRLILLNRITERGLIANGGYGGVREAELRDDPESTTFEVVAVKRLFPQGDDHQRIELSTAFARELKTWAATDHPNILPLIGFFLDAESAVALFVSPFMPHGSIRTYIRKAKPGPAKRLDLAIDTAEGLAYLHSRNPPICHGDIKPSNVVINHKLRAMFCDFGLARVVQDHPSGLTTAGFDQAGTLPYMSPELVHVPGTRRNAKTDTWAWAGVLVEVLTDEQPFGKCNSFLIPGKLKECIPPVPVDALPVSVRMQSLLGRCWVKEPGERPDMGESSNELKLERATLGNVEDATVNDAPPGVPEEDPVPESLVQALAALRPYHISEEIVQFDASYDGPPLSIITVLYRRDHRARLRGRFRWAADGAAIAVAKLTLSGERRERLEVVEKFIRQISIWAGSNDPNVYPLLGFSVNHEFGEIWFIGPWEENGNLQDYLDRVMPSQAKRIGLAIDVAKGLRYLHGQSPAVIHGDMRPHNIVVGAAGQAMITDFGSAVVRERTGPTIPRAVGGLPPYEAPEVQGNHGLIPASDVWSFACLLLKIFLQKDPEYSWERERRGDQMPTSAKTLSTLPKDLRQLMLLCWKLAPDERPTIQHCIDALTRLLEQETQNPSPFVPGPSMEESSSKSNSTLDAHDIDVGTGTSEALVVPEEIRPDQDEEPQPGASWCCVRCVIQ